MMPRGTPIEGVIPVDTFYPVPKPEGGYYLWNKRNKLEASALLIELAPDMLGVSKGRLWTMLGGGYMSDVQHIGKKWRLSHALLERLTFLFYLKARYPTLNTSAINSIDWKKGELYLNEGEQLRYTAKQDLPLAKATA